MGIDFESQATIDEAIDRTVTQLRTLLQTTLNALDAERINLEAWISGMRITIGPIVIPAFDITIGGKK